MSTMIETTPTSKPRSITDEEKLYAASQWQLMWIAFRKHKLAVIAGIMLILIYVVTVGLAEFFSPYPVTKTHRQYTYAPPQRVRFFDAEGRFHLFPFVYGYEIGEDPLTWQKTFTPDPTQMQRLRFFVRGDEYQLWGLFRSDLRFLGAAGDEPIFLFGTDSLGRDLLSRTLHAGRISLSVGFVGIAISFFLGNILGGISGYYGGTIDMVIQRVIEFFISIPTIPLWMALAAALPANWPSLRVYFGITVILSFIGWTGLARVVRGKLLELREEDFVMAAKLAGARDSQIILRHLLPSFMSYLIVSLTLAVPGMILGETALSFLGLGLRPPVVSWGVLLQAAQSFQAVALHPWLLIPGLFVILVVLCFNFLGDGLRDAADPYSYR